MATIILPPGSTSVDLQTAVDGAAFGDIIEISGDMPFSGTVTIPQGLEITIQSPANSYFSMLQFTPNIRHFAIDGSLILENIVVDGRNIGGGVQLTRGAFAMQHNAAVQNCLAENGGGVEVIAGVFSIYDGDTGKPFPLKGGEVRNNTATNGGGVYLHAGFFNMSTSDGVIKDNTATGNGGGVYVAGGTYRLTGGDVINNKAVNGGGLYVNAGSLSMNRGNFTGNKAAVNGGGIYVSEVANLEMEGSVISVKNNSVLEGSGGGIYTEVADYANITTSSAVVFQCNTALFAYNPPEDADLLYPDVQYAQTTITEHPLNNYDINYSDGEPISVTHHVNYDANGGTGSHSGSDIGPCGTDTVLSVEDTGIIRRGYVCNGWNTEPDGSGTAYMPGDEIAITDDITLYAQWEPYKKPSCWRFCERFRREFCRMFCEEFCCDDYCCNIKCRCACEKASRRVCDKLCGRCEPLL